MEQDFFIFPKKHRDREQNNDVGLWSAGRQVRLSAYLLTVTHPSPRDNPASQPASFHLFVSTFPLDPAPNETSIAI